MPRSIGSLFLNADSDVKENDKKQKNKSGKKSKVKTADAGAKSDKIRIEHLNYKVLSLDALLNDTELTGEIEIRCGNEDHGPNCWNPSAHLARFSTKPIARPHTHHQYLASIHAKARANRRR